MKYHANDPTWTSKKPVPFKARGISESEKKRFDDYYKEFVDDSKLLSAHTQQSLKEFRLAKTCAYRMATNYLAMLQQHHTELRAQAKTTGQTLDEWLMQSFQPLTIVGENYRELVAAVQDGMRLRQYLAETPGIFLRRKQSCKKKMDAIAKPLPVEPKPTLSAKDTIVMLRTRSDVAVTQNVDLRLELRRAQRTIAQQDRLIRKLQAHLNKMTPLFEELKEESQPLA